MAERIQDGYRLTEADGEVTIRSHAEQPAWHWIGGLVFFLVVVLAGGDSLVDMA